MAKYINGDQLIEFWQGDVFQHSKWSTDIIIQTIREFPEVVPEIDIRSAFEDTISWANNNYKPEIVDGIIRNLVYNLGRRGVLSQYYVNYIEGFLSYDREMKTER